MENRYVSNFERQSEAIRLSDDLHQRLSKNRSYPKRVTFKSQILDFVENNNGKARWKEIHNFMTTFKGWGKSCESNRGYGSAYFSGISGGMSYMYHHFHPRKTGDGRRGIITRGSSNDPRYLQKEGIHWVLKKE